MITDLHCAACGRARTPDQFSGSTWSRRLLCERCATILDRWRDVPANLAVRQDWKGGAL